MSSELPPPMPPPLDYAPPPARMDLRNVAVRQKGVIFCILAYLVLIAAQAATPMHSGSPLRLLIALVALGVMITGTVFVFMLSLTLYNTAAGIVLGLLTLIPLVGLVVLLIINGRATATLRRHGIKVGLLGARTSQIPAAGAVPLG